MKLARLALSEPLAARAPHAALGTRHGPCRGEQIARGILHARAGLAVAATSFQAALCLNLASLPTSLVAAVDDVAAKERNVLPRTP